MKNSYDKLKEAIDQADAIVIGAGSGLSTATGMIYDGKRFMDWFSDFHEQYGINDMYSGGFYPFPDEETYWAWWARAIYINRYLDAPKPVYKNLLEMVKDKDYFVITTNVDHLFQKAGFDKSRLFYTQGDYGLFQSDQPGAHETFDNKDWVYQAMKAQGFELNENNEFIFPKNKEVKTRIPSSLIPILPDGTKAIPNLRIDSNFAQDDGWYQAAHAYDRFLEEYKNENVVYLELGIGQNTPGVIKYPFWRMVYASSKAKYICINAIEAYAPVEIRNRSLCIQEDIDQVLSGYREEG